jgi:hypothetical protein
MATSNKENMQPDAALTHHTAEAAKPKKWHEDGKGFEIMERILKPLVGVFNDVMQELHDSRVPDVGREEEDVFMSKAVQYIRQYILSDRVTMRYLTEREALAGLVTALCAGELDGKAVGEVGRKRSFVTSLILSTSPFIAVLEKNTDIMEILLVGYDQAAFDVDDALCHSVARVLTSLIESKNSHNGIFSCAKRDRATVARKFFESMNCDAMLFIYLEMVGASEEKRLADLEAYCRDFAIVDRLLEMLATSMITSVVKNVLEAIVTVSSCFADMPAKLSSFIAERTIAKVIQCAVAGGSPPNATVCRLAALTHLAILDTTHVAVAVANHLPAVRAMLQNVPGAYCEDRKHKVYERPVGSVRIAVVELLVAFIDKSRNTTVEPVMPELIEEVMLFFCDNTMNDFIGIEMVQLVRRVLASNVPRRILHGMLTHRALEGIRAAIEKVSNIWELGHLRCIVSDILAKYDNDEPIRMHLDSYPHWEHLHTSMSQIKNAKVVNPRRKRRGHVDGGTNDDCPLPVSPLSVLAAGEPHKTLCNGIIVHEDTPRKVMYVTQSTLTMERVPTPVHGQGHAKGSPCSPRTAAQATDILNRELF